MAFKSSKSQRRSPTQERSIDLVDSVLEAARGLLSSTGKATTIKIAQAAGVGIGSLYEYFENKESVFQSLLDDSIIRNIKYVEEKFDLTTAENIETEVPKIIDHLVEHYYDGRKFIDNLFGSLPYATVNRMTKESRLRATDVIVEELRKRGVAFPSLRTEIFLFINCFLELMHVMAYMDSVDRANEFSKDEIKKYLSDAGFMLVSKSRHYFENTQATSFEL